MSQMEDMRKRKIIAGSVMGYYSLQLPHLLAFRRSLPFRLEDTRCL